MLTGRDLDQWSYNYESALKERLSKQHEAAARGILTIEQLVQNSQPLYAMLDPSAAYIEEELAKTPEFEFLPSSIDETQDAVMLEAESDVPIEDNIQPVEEVLHGDRRSWCARSSI